MNNPILMKKKTSSPYRAQEQSQGEYCLSYGTPSLACHLSPPLSPHHPHPHPHPRPLRPQPLPLHSPFILQLASSPAMKKLYLLCFYDCWFSFYLMTMYTFKVVFLPNTQINASAVLTIETPEIVSLHFIFYPRKLFDNGRYGAMIYGARCQIFDV